MCNDCFHAMNTKQHRAGTERRKTQWPKLPFHFKKQEKARKGNLN